MQLHINFAPREDCPTAFPLGAVAFAVAGGGFSSRKD